MKKYKEFIINAEPFNAEIISGVLWELDIEGTNEEVGALTVFAPEDTNITIQTIEEKLNKLKEVNLLFNFTVEENIVEEKNWNEEWEKNTNVIEISNFVIKPTFKDYENTGNKIIIEIDPKMSFGTGEHQTTKLMLMGVEKYLNVNDAVLDAGTGTGVLAIAAEKMNSGNIIAFDIDEWSYNNSLENIELNKCTKINLYHGDINSVKETGFNLVLANIQKNILISIKTELIEKMHEGGKLILSGLLTIDEEAIKNAFCQSGLKLIDKMQIDEWISMVFTK